MMINNQFFIKCLSKYFVVFVLCLVLCYNSSLCVIEFKCLLFKNDIYLEMYTVFLEIHPITI